MIKEITEKDVEGARYLLELPGTGGKIAIQALCKNNKLTKLFIDEFRQYITPELFSLSPGLDYSLISEYPDLFDENIWKTGAKKSLDPLLEKQFRKKFTDEEIFTLIENATPYEITEDIFNTLFDLYGIDFKNLLLSKYKGTFDTEFLVKNADLISADIFKNRSVVDNLSIKLIERILKAKTNLTMRFFTIAIGSINDISWQERMLNEVDSGKIVITSSGETFDSELKSIIAVMHDDNIGKLFPLLNKYDRNAISYSVLEFLLRTKDMSEDLCLELLQNFKANNLVHALGKYARENDFQSVLIGLAL